MDKIKKFQRFLVNKRYLVSVDGTQKMCRDHRWDVDCLDRTFHRGEENEQSQCYVYVLQATLTLSDGMSIPLMTEFLSYSEGDSDRDKQDCELKAFYRLADRNEFPRCKQRGISYRTASLMRCKSTTAPSGGVLVEFRTAQAVVDQHN
jgi:hypothetical protein